MIIVSLNHGNFNLKEKILMNKLVSALLVAALATAGATLFQRLIRSGMKPRR